MRETWGKESTGVIEKIKCIEKNLPFKIKGFNSDNGSEFLNHSLLNYFTDRKDKVAFTRSRPYRKNDNAHVEQKNWSCVRQLLGYDRFEHKEMVYIINDIYMNKWSLLNNYFIPTMKLENKIKNRSQIKKIHSKPITPYERLLASNTESRSNSYNTTCYRSQCIYFIAHIKKPYFYLTISVNRYML